MKIFISHSSNEANIANELCKVVENNGNQCFLASRDIRSGFPYAEEIANGIDSSDVVLLIMSKAANRSPHVLREVERAVTNSIPILVYTLEEVELTKSMEYFLMTHQWMFAGRDSYEDVINSINNIKNDEVVYGKKVGFENPKKKSGLAVFAIVALLVVAITVGVLMFTGIGKDKGDNNVAKTTANETSSTQNVVTNAPSVETTKKFDGEIHLGDIIVFGRYNGENIYWRILKLSEDKKSAVVISRDVLTMKAYDVAESGKYNYKDGQSYYAADSDAETDMQLQAFVRGDSNWYESNIRTWLNSDREVVVYEGQAPASSAMAEGKNGYDGEPGFLNAFTQVELDAILTTQLETKENALNEGGMFISEDKVFLLSKDELVWFDEAGISMLAKPTKAAIDKNETSWYKEYCLDFGVENMMWWLREVVPGSSSKCYLVGNGYYEKNIYEWEVGKESFGIRPAMTIDLTSECIRIVE